MTNFDDDLVRHGLTGAVTVGPHATPFPTLLNPYDAPFVDLGYISDDGLEEAREEDSQDFVPWNRRGPVRSDVLTETITFAFTLWTTSFDSVSLYYKVKAADMDYDETEGVVSFVDGDQKDKDRRAFGFDILDGVYARRYEVPNGEITAREGQTYVKGTLIGYPMTCTAFTTAAGWSVKRKFKEGWAPPTISSGPTITTMSLPAGVVGTPYSQTLLATGGSGTKTWTVDSGSLPAGLVLSNTGVISGTPTAAGTPSVTFKVTDAASASATKALTVTVTA